ncbi:MMPL family transporter [Aquibacillus kalidii]|uniref:MMPL family transporter n=1 Tax=Aquibacillus kalidii TaxID=2762597 RepID=UPI001644AEBE|nr:MMPL family transporter [Aquibacillus kalidii]
MHNFFDFLSNIISKLRWGIVTVWMIVLLVAGMFAGQLTPLLSGGGWTVDGSDSLKTNELLSKDFTGRSGTSITLVVRDKENGVKTEAYQKNLQEAIDYIENNKKLEVASIYTYLNAPEDAKESLVGDENTTLAFIGFNEDDGFARNELPSLQEDIKKHFKNSGLDIYLVGAASFWGEINVLSQEGLAKAELITLPLVLIILLLVFRSLVAAVTPLIVAVASVVTTLGIMTFIAQQIELSMFVTNAATMLGLGVGIDYSLFMVNRFREEIAKHGDKKKALSTTMKTAGDAVFFSALTIIACMSVLFMVDLGVIQSIAIGAIAIVAITLLVSLTLLPAVLYILGTNINKGKIPFLSRKKEKSSFWYNWSHKIMKRPVIFLILSLIILGMLAIPSKDLSTFTPDARILPEESDSRMGYEIIQDDFSEGYTSPIYVAVESSGDSFEQVKNVEYLITLSERLSELEHVDIINSLPAIFKNTDPNTIVQTLKGFEQVPEDLQGLVNRYLDDEKQVAIIEVIPEHAAASDQTRSLVAEIKKEIKDINIPENVSAYVGGETAEGIDSNQVIEDSFTKVLVVMLIIGYFILLLTFKSVWLPLKAILMNLISLGATYGILIFVFQYGYGSELLNFTPADYVQNFVPILLLTLLFSLSTDYEVFLISRIKEDYEKGFDNEESVATGLQATAPMISGAAILMIAVFGAFTITSVLPIQQLGLGMAVAIAIDATIIRLIVVPVTMRLLGDLNWWFPGKMVKKQTREMAK